MINKILIPVISLLIAAVFFIASFLPEYQASNSPVELVKNDLDSPSSTLATKAVKFVESSHRTGLIFEHQSRSKSLSGIADVLGSGLCVIDFDQDGFQDVFAVSGRGATRRYGLNHWWNKKATSQLFRNVSGQYFTHFPIKLDTQQVITGYGCTVGDVNQDGWDDLLIGDIGQIHLLLNAQGQGFDHQIIELPQPDTWPSGLTLYDINTDEHLDLLVSTLVQFKNDLKVGNQEYGYKAISFPKVSNYQAQPNYALIASGVSGAVNFEVQPLAGLYPTYTLTPESWLGVDKSNKLIFSNAEGANSVLYDTRIGRNASEIFSWSTLSTSQVTLLPESESIIIPNPVRGGIQVFNLAGDSRNRAWDIGLTNDLIDSQKVWSVLVQDFNNNGRSDVVYATGFETPALNTPTRTEGSDNQLLLQQQIGKFEQIQQAFSPELKGSTRGAVWLDFNNDGYQDIIFSSNNSYLSLYLNQGEAGKAIAFDCMPSADCANSHWTINLVDKSLEQDFDKPQPFLSSTSKRVHFGLGDYTGSIDLTVKLGNGKIIKHISLIAGKIYQLNLVQNTLTLVRENESEEDDNEPLNIHKLFVKLMRSTEFSEFESEILYLTSLNSHQWIELLDLLDNYQVLLSSQAQFENKRVLRVIGHALSWLFKNELRSEQYQRVLDGVTNSVFKLEYDGFVPYLPSLLRLQSTPSYCRSMTKLAYWLEEEEVLPQTKMGLIPELLHDLEESDLDRFLCTIEALSYSEDPTLGYSLLPYLNDKRAPVRSGVIAALGRLKYAKSESYLKEHCNKELELWTVIECNISLSKLNAQLPIAKNKVLTKLDEYMRLHPGAILLNQSQLYYSAKLMSADWSSYLKTKRYFTVGLFGLINSYRSGVTPLSNVKNILEELDEGNLINSMLILSKKSQPQFETALPILLSLDKFSHHFKPLKPIIYAASTNVIKSLMDQDILNPYKYGGVFFKLCKNKPSLLELCNKKSKSEHIKLNRLGKISLQYLLYLGSPLQKNVAVQRVIKNHPDLLIDVLNSESYAFIPRNKQDLIEQLLVLAWEHKIMLRPEFIENLSKFKNTEHHILLSLYQEINGNKE